MDSLQNAFALTPGSGPPHESRRAAANRLNAQKSTGPRTEVGKANSRRNALKHGLAGAGIVMPTEFEEEVGRKAQEWSGSLLPKNAVERELVEIGAAAMTRLKRCWREESSARGRAAARAELAWDDDRRAGIERLAERIGENPARVVAELRGSLQGAEWLADRWRELDRRLRAGRDLTPSQRELALDLLGVPSDFRDDFTPVDFPDLEPGPARSPLREVIAREVARLDSAIDGHLAEIDASDRDARAADLPSLDDAEIDRYRRYERSLTGRVLSVLSVLRRGAVRSDETKPTAPSRRDETNPPPPPSPSVETATTASSGSGSALNVAPSLLPAPLPPTPAEPSDPASWLEARSDSEVESVLMPLLMARLNRMQAELREQLGDDPEPDGAAH